mmetsp:Transcript_8580/g.18469  ORF Transcript_8580/g.18469 Transcript_8580/m.18469 type:complete len:176 (-) Transcript_8580:53-580(-)
MSNRTAAQNLSIAAASVTAVAAIYHLSRVVSQCGGVGGFFRFVWEGDHLTPDVREAVDALDELESNGIPKEEKRLEKVEIAIETARLNSVDDPSPTPGEQGDATDLDNIFEQYPQIKNDLSMLSYQLDKVAANIDSVQSCGSVEVKRRKKYLSNLLVKMMEKTDGLIASCGGGVK